MNCKEARKQLADKNRELRQHGSELKAYARMRERRHNGLLSPDEMALVLGMSTTTLGKWRDMGRGPAWEKIDGYVVYPAKHLAIWMRRRLLA